MDKVTMEQVLAGLHPELVLTGLTLENLRFIKDLLAKEDALDDLRQIREDNLKAMRMLADGEV